EDVTTGKITPVERPSRLWTTGGGWKFRMSFKTPDVPDAAGDTDGAASACNALVTNDIDCGVAETIVCAWPAVEVPAAWATVAAWPVSPPRLVACRAGVNGAIAEAAAESPA